MRILFATDGSDAADAARRFLEALRLPEGSAVRAVAVVPIIHPMMSPSVETTLFTWEAVEPLLEAEGGMMRDALADAEQALARSGVEFTSTIRRGDPAHVILQEAEEWGAELVVVGSRGLSGLDSLLLGSVARNVAKHCSCPVLVARAPGHSFHNALLATDGSPHAQDAARFAARLSLSEQTEWTALHVVRPPRLHSLLPERRGEHGDVATEIDQRQRAEAEAVVKNAAAELGAGGGTVRTAIRDGDPAAEIVKCAREHHADLIVAGSRGVSPIEALLVGSVADRLLKEAHCSVLLVR